MKYIGRFKDIDDINDYKVVIVTNGDDSKSTDIELGASPFVTTMDTEGDTIYKTAKYQGATITYVGANHYFDLYSATPQQNKVTLYKNDNVEWVGYTSPNAYSQDWVGYDCEMEFDVIDGLSTLQYYKYTPIGENKDVVTFVDLINNLLTKCNCYRNWYMTDNTKLTSASTESFIQQLVISEENFFDEKDDEKTSDDDVAWDCKEVLEELCQFLNVTVIAVKDEVFFIDYDAIKNGINTYWKYAVGDSIGTKVTISASRVITGDDLADAGQSVSLGDIYNKVSITSELYDFDSIIPSMYDNLKNITADSDDTLKDSTNVNNGMYGEVIKSSLDESSAGNMIIMLDRVRNPQKSEFKDYNVVAVKYFDNPNYKFYKYKWDGSKLVDVTDTLTTLNYTDSKSLYGASIAKFFVKKIDKPYSYFQILTQQLLNKQIGLDGWMAKNDITSLSFSNYIMMLNPNDHHIQNEELTSYPYFSTTISDTTALFGGDNSYLLISGSYYFHYFTNDTYPIPDGEADIAEGRYAMDNSDVYLVCKLQWGNQYWNGSGWTSTDTTFKLPYIKDNTSKGDRRADATMFKDLEFVNTVNWRIGTTEKGYLIKTPNNKVINGMPKLTVYKPFDPNYHSAKSGDNKGRYYKHNVVFLKDFNIKAIITDPTFSDAQDTDTKYVNVINKGYVNELSDISWKINTWDNKKPNYSAVAYKDDSNELNWLDKTYNQACNEGEKTWMIEDDDAPNMNDGARQEEHSIYRLVNQYSQPSIILSINLNYNDFKPYTLVSDKYLLNKKLIADTYNIDYANNKIEATLIEKK